MPPIHIEIWSDLVCPFCYIGKRHLEAALEQFSGREQVKITWRSFELDPSPEREEGKNLYQRLAEKYGESLAWAKETSDQVTKTAEAAGLHFHLDRAVPANTFNAHRLIHLAATRGLQDAAEERFFRAYFTEGKNLADAATLADLSKEIGLSEKDVAEVLAGDKFSAEVRADEQTAWDNGINAVPFFLFNRKYMVRGAQPVAAFVSALHLVEAELNKHPQSS